MSRSVVRRIAPTIFSSIFQEQQYRTSPRSSVADVSTPSSSISARRAFRSLRLANGVSFDINGDGVPDQVAWTASNDGILAYDVNGSGTIENGTELFTPNFAGGNYASGLAALDEPGQQWRRRDQQRRYQLRQSAGVARQQPQWRFAMPENCRPLPITGIVGDQLGRNADRCNRRRPAAASARLVHLRRRHDWYLC